MKRFLLLVLALALTVSVFLTACKKDPVDPIDPTTDPVTDAPETDPVDPVVTDRPVDANTPIGSVSYLDQDGTVTLRHLRIPADDFQILGSFKDSLLGESNLLILMWNIEKDLPVDQHLALLNTTEGMITDWKYDISDYPLPTNIVRRGDEILVYGQNNSYHFGWILSGAPANPTVTLLETKEEIDAFVSTSPYITSPDGKYTVYRKLTDLGTLDGGIWLDGENRYLMENVTLEEGGVQGTRGYTPVAFIDNDTFIYSITGWEWNVGYGIYNIPTGDDTRREDGRTILYNGSDYFYTADTKNYSLSAIYKEALDGTRTKLLDESTRVESLKPLVSESLLGLTVTDEAFAFAYAEEGYQKGLCLRINVYDRTLETRRIAARIFLDRYATVEWFYIPGQVVLLTAGN